jgi:DnaJ-class molecular chaperone
LEAVATLLEEAGSAVANDRDRYAAVILIVSFVSMIRVFIDSIHNQSPGTHTHAHTHTHTHALSRIQDGPMRGSDIQLGMELEFMEAVNGMCIVCIRVHVILYVYECVCTRVHLSVCVRLCATGIEKDVSLRAKDPCGTCAGDGKKPGTKSRTCHVCQGHGRMQQSQGFFTVEIPCSTCKGTGQLFDACTTCGGLGVVTNTKTVKVSIPAGVDNDSKVRLRDQGDAGVRRGPRGHLYLHLRVKPSKVFRREGTDVHVEVPISVTQAMLGGRVSVPVLGGEVVMKIDAGTQPNEKRRMSGKGVKVLNKDRKGDQYITFKVSVPTGLSARGHELVHELAVDLGEETEELGDGKRGFFGKVYRWLSNEEAELDEESGAHKKKKRAAEN